MGRTCRGHGCCHGERDRLGRPEWYRFPRLGLLLLRDERRISERRRAARHLGRRLLGGTGEGRCANETRRLRSRRAACGGFATAVLARSGGGGRRPNARGTGAAAG